MDNMRNYMQQQEQNLSLEEVDDKVWREVRLSLQKEKSVSWMFKGTSQGNLLVKKIQLIGLQLRANRVRWSLALALPILLIFFSAFRVNREEKVGALLSFSIASQNSAYYNKVESIQKYYGFRFTQISLPSEPGRFSFIGYIEATEADKLTKMTKDLYALPTLRQLKLKTIAVKVNESLLSDLLYKIVRVHIYVSKPPKTDIKRKVEAELKHIFGADLSVSISKTGRMTLHSNLSSRVDTIASLVIPAPVLPRVKKQAQKKYSATTSEQLSAFVERYEERTFVLTPATNQKELDRLQMEIAALGYRLYLDKTTFQEQLLLRISGSLHYLGKRSHHFDSEGFASIIIVLNERKRPGTFKVEIAMPPIMSH